MTGKRIATPPAGSVVQARPLLRLAYQGFAQGSYIGDIVDLIRMVRLQPDLTIILDVSDATSARPEG
jgi:hypothetical protein